MIIWLVTDRETHRHRLLGLVYVNLLKVIKTLKTKRHAGGYNLQDSKERQKYKWTHSLNQKIHFQSLLPITGEQMQQHHTHKATQFTSDLGPDKYRYSSKSMLWVAI